MGLFATLLAAKHQTVVHDESSSAMSDAAAASSTTTTTTNASSLSLPTVLQLYTTDKPFLFVSLDNTNNEQFPSFAPMTFQAVQVQALTEDFSSAAAAGPTNMAVGLRKQHHNNKHLPHHMVHVVPDLGIWNCRVSTKLMLGQQQQQEPPLIDSLLMIPTTTTAAASNKTFCWKIDLTVKDLSKVEPAITAMQNALVRHLIQQQQQQQSPGSSGSAPAAATTTTTSLYQLRTVQFGLAAVDNNDDDDTSGKNENAAAAATTTATAAAPSPADHDVKIALHLAVLWPTTSSSNSNSSSKEDDYSYQRQQTLALLYYHLRRYAAALEASLVFVRPSSVGSSGTGNKPETTTAAAAAAATTTTDLQPLLSLPQLATIWRALAQGDVIWKETIWKELLASEHQEPTGTATTTNDDDDDDDKKNKDVETGYLPIYGPDSATDLIETVLRRNANYPGHWDAAKDSVWKILPASSSAATMLAANNNKKASASSSSSSSGDQGWLQELRDSVALPTETAVEKTPNKPTTTASADKTPDVSDYFSQFLK